MKKEILLLDKSICMLSDFKVFTNLDLSCINWDLLFSYGLQSKSICMLYNKLVYSDCLKKIPSKYYKLMSAIYIGNDHHNQLLSHTRQLLSNMLSVSGIELFDYKNISMDKYFKKNLMPNDIDVVARKSNALEINSFLLSNGYHIKYVNGDAFVEELPETFNSVFYEKNPIYEYDYPIKIDINYSFQRNWFLEHILTDYNKQESLTRLSFILISMIDFYEHINCNIDNIKIEDLLKLKRLNIQLNSLNHYESDMLFEMANRYDVVSDYSIVRDVVKEYISLF